MTGSSDGRAATGRQQSGGSSGGKGLAGAHQQLCYVVAGGSDFVRCMSTQWQPSALPDQAGHKQAVLCSKDFALGVLQRALRHLL